MKGSEVALKGSAEWAGATLTGEAESNQMPSSLVERP